MSSSGRSFHSRSLLVNQERSRPAAELRSRPAGVMLTHAGGAYSAALRTGEQATANCSLTSERSELPRTQPRRIFPCRRGAENAVASRAPAENVPPSDDKSRDVNFILCRAVQE